MRRRSWYRRLLALFPADFRGQFGSEMEADFADQHHDAASRGRGAVAGLWARTIAGFLRVGPREHVRQVVADIRYGLRLAARQPGSTLASAVVLGLGIAAVTGGFTIVDAFLLRPLPFADPDRLVHVWSTDRQTGTRSGRSSLPDIDAWRSSPALVGLAAFNYTEEDLTGEGRPERISAARVSANVFDVLGVAPQTGRGFTEGEDRPGAAPVAIVSRRFAEMRLGGVEGSLHRRLEIGGRAHTVVGVVAASFVFPLPMTDVWLPYTLDPDIHTWEVQTFQAVARLAPGVSVAAAEQELAALTRSVAAPHGERGRQRGVRFESLRNALNFADEGFRIAGPVMMLAASLILLAACANVSSVLLGQAITRAREVAVRSAVGASRLRLFRQFFFESLSMGAASLLVGLLLARTWLWWVQGLLPLDLYRVGELAIDLRTTAVAAAASGAALLLSAGLPALRFGRTNVADVLRMDGASTTMSPRAARLQTALLVAQVTFSVALLASALAALGVVRSLGDQQPGFERDRVLTMKFILGDDRYRDRASLVAFHDRALAEVGTVAGVERAAVVNHLPLNHETNLVPYSRPGTDTGVSGQRRTAVELSVSPGYFATMGIPLRHGRPFDTRDTLGGQPVAIVNRELASRLWGTAAPDGRQLELGAGRTLVTVVGVVEDSRHRELVGEPEAIVYRPFAQAPSRHARLVIPASTGPAALTDAASEAVWRVDPLLPLTEVRSLDEVVVEFLLPQRAMSISMSNMGITALLVTAIGLYGALAVFVAQRRREIGVRMALGATRTTVVNTIVWRSVRTIAIGLVCGLALSSAMMISMAAVLPGARPVDPAAAAGTLAILAAVAFAASYVPARRATRVDPLVVLRG